MKSLFKALIILTFVNIILLISSPLQAQINKGKGSMNTVGIRLGWDGAPNGFSFAHKLYNSGAIEFYFGYNDKEGRMKDANWLHKGNTMAGVLYTPYLTPLGVHDKGTLYGSFGGGFRLHHYRGGWFGRGKYSQSKLPSKITPDLKAGMGVLFVPGRKVELFLDIHIDLHNTLQNKYRVGLESGLGFRIALN